MSSIVPNTFQTPNVYVDRLMQYLSDGELRVLLYAVRHIFGWQDRAAERRAHISLSMFENGFTTSKGELYAGCGLSRTAISRNLNELVKFAVLIKLGTPTQKGQEWTIGESPDWNGLEERRQLQGEAQKKKTANASAALKVKRATKASGGSSNDTPSGGSSNDTPSGSSNDTPSGSSNDTNQSHIQSHIQNQIDDQPPTELLISKLIRWYEDAFGRAISFMDAETLKDYAAEYAEDWIADAFRMSKERRANSLAYTTKILERWKKQGSKTTAKPADQPVATADAQAAQEKLDALIESILATLPTAPPNDYLPDKPADMRAFAWSSTGRRSSALQRAQAQLAEGKK